MANGNGMGGVVDATMLEIVLDAAGMSLEEHARLGALEKVGVQYPGTTEGKPSVSLLIRDLETGKPTVAITSLALFLTAAEAFMARYGDPRVPGWRPPFPSAG